MLKKLLENKSGHPMSNVEFAIVMSMTTEDIKFNNISFKKKTNINEVIVIAARCAIAFKKCA
jgi:hypothetical protein